MFFFVFFIGQYWQTTARRRVTRSTTGRFREGERGQARKKAAIKRLLKSCCTFDTFRSNCIYIQQEITMHIKCASGVGLGLSTSAPPCSVQCALYGA